MLGRVARGRHGAPGQTGRHERVAVGGRPMRKAQGGGRTRDDGGARAGGELAAAGDEIGVQVSLQAVSNRPAAPAGGVDIAVDVTLRVDRNGAPAALGRDPVGGIPKPLVEEVLDPHGATYGLRARIG